MRGSAWECVGAPIASSSWHTRGERAKAPGTRDWVRERKKIPLAGKSRPDPLAARHQIESPKRSPKEPAQGRLAVNSRTPGFQKFVRLSGSCRQSGGPAMRLGPAMFRSASLGRRAFR
jgi:hypothetical protein